MNYIQVYTNNFKIILIYNQCKFQLRFCVQRHNVKYSKYEIQVITLIKNITKMNNLIVVRY